MVVEGFRTNLLKSQAAKVSCSYQLRALDLAGVSLATFLQAPHPHSSSEGKNAMNLNLQAVATAVQGHLSSDKQFFSVHTPHPCGYGVGTATGLVGGVASTAPWPVPCLCKSKHAWQRCRYYVVPIHCCCCAGPVVKRANSPRVLGASAMRRIRAGWWWGVGQTAAHSLTHSLTHLSTHSNSHVVHRFVMLPG